MGDFLKHALRMETRDWNETKLGMITCLKSSICEDKIINLCTEIWCMSKVTALYLNATYKFALKFLTKLISWLIKLI